MKKENQFLFTEKEVFSYSDRYIKQQRKFKFKERIRLHQSRLGFLSLAMISKTFPSQFQAFHGERKAVILIHFCL